MSPDEKKYGSRTNPRHMLTPDAAVNLSKESGRAIWVLMPMYEGKFHIFPGGRKEFWPDKRVAERDSNG